VLLTIGRPGVVGDPPEALSEPTSVVVAPNGDIFIAEGHSGQMSDAPPDSGAMIRAQLIRSCASSLELPSVRLCSH